VLCIRVLANNRKTISLWWVMVTIRKVSSAVSDGSKRIGSVGEGTRDGSERTLIPIHLSSRSSSGRSLGASIHATCSSIDSLTRWWMSWGRAVFLKEGQSIVGCGTLPVLHMPCTRS